MLGSPTTNRNRSQFSGQMRLYSCTAYGTIVGRSSALASARSIATAGYSCITSSRERCRSPPISASAARDTRRRSPGSLGRGSVDMALPSDLTAEIIAASVVAVPPVA